MAGHRAGYDAYGQIPGSTIVETSSPDSRCRTQLPVMPGDLAGDDGRRHLAAGSAGSRRRPAAVPSADRPAGIEVSNQYELAQ